MPGLTSLTSSVNLPFTGQSLGNRLRWSAAFLNVCAVTPSTRHTMKSEKSGDQLGWLAGAYLPGNSLQMAFDMTGHSVT